ncbi:MAG: undecaprenyl/decaprenyl-phosphate alpha-N-acetylglucosaminyl 1-phosphate transferase [Chloroflexi bacterium]|nr:undecaprenyl/decaprenyl-phosphate alpha-N-acetylglucosaminyl 1-phosphate transferase [Chloroflexota bacterium]
MITWMVILVAAFVLAIGATPLARRVALHTGMVDQPSARKIHQSPIPLLGGVAMYTAFVVALILFADRFYISQMVSIVVGATWVSFLGVWDDRVHLRASVKLIGQIFGALILVAAGITVEIFNNPIFDTAITLFWIIGITNAMNLLDNMDGLSGGVAAVAAAFFMLLAAENGQFLVGSLSAALLGVAIGFLIYNFNPALIFMGDSGSLFIGFMLAAVGIKLRFPDHPLISTWFIPILVLGLPIFDTTLVFVSRLRRGLNPMTHAGKDHISHRLVARGLTVREAVLALYLVSGVFGMVAVFCAQGNVLASYFALALVITASLVGLYEFEFKKERLKTLEKR